MYTYKVTVQQFDNAGALLGSVEHTVYEDSEEQLTFGKTGHYTFTDENASAMSLIMGCDHTLIKLGEHL